MTALLFAVLAAADVQALIDRARPGDRVTLPPGVHAGPISILKPLTLEGGGRAVIDGGGRGTIARSTATGRPVAASAKRASTR